MSAIQRLLGPNQQYETSVDNLRRMMERSDAIEISYNNDIIAEDIGADTAVELFNDLYDAPHDGNTVSVSHDLFMVDYTAEVLADTDTNDLLTVSASYHP